MARPPRAPLWHARSDIPSRSGLWLLLRVAGALAVMASLALVAAI